MDFEYTDFSHYLGVNNFNRT